MKPLILLLFLISSHSGFGDDIFKIAALDEQIRPFEATWEVKFTHNPQSKNESKTSRTVKAQFVDRKRFKIKNGPGDYSDASNSIIDDEMETLVPIIALRSYLKWHERQIVGIGEDENLLICESVSNVRFYGKLRIELERKPKLRVKRVFFYKYDHNGKTIPQRKFEFEYDDEDPENQLASIFPVKSKVTYWDDQSSRLIKEGEIWLQVVADADKQGKPIPGGRFLTGTVQAKL